MRVTAAMILAVVASLMAAPVAAQSDDAAADTPLRLVGLGGSWAEGAHCGYCQTFLDLWADDIREVTGREVEVTDLTGQQEPGLTPGTGATTSTMLETLRFNPTTKDAIRDADIILIATGGNEIDALWTPPAGGDCSGALQMECVRAIERVWVANFDSILEEIELLRQGAPTAIRLVDEPNLFLLDPENWAILEEELRPTDGAVVWQSLYEAVCGAAEAHGAVCVDVRPIINGPSMDQPGDDTTPEAMRGVADALLATGLLELE